MRLEALATVRPESFDNASTVRPEPFDPAQESPVEGPDRCPQAEVVPLPLARDPLGVWRTDWASLLPMLGDETLAAAERAASFHLSLAQALVEQAKQLRAQTGILSVGLTGGVFQNRVLAEAAIGRLEAAGFTVHLPRRVPVNDAGLSFGQVIEFLHQ